VPIKNTPEIIKNVAPLIREDGLIMDIASIKKEPLDTMLKHAKCSVLATHPLFGPSNGLEGQIIAFCGGRGKKWHDEMQKLFESSGVLIKNLSAKEHDKIMSTVQGLTHFVSIVLANALAKGNLPLKKYLDFQTPAYRITVDFLGRILNQNPELYGSIQIENSLNVDTISRFIESSQKFLEIVKTKNLDEFKDFFNEGKDYLGDFTNKAQNESDLIINIFTQIQKEQKRQSLWQDQDQNAELVVLGPKNTYSHLASEKHFPKKRKYFARNIPELFELIDNDDIKEGFAPLENKLEGTVNATLDELFHRDIFINDIKSFEITHCLFIKKSANPNKINKVYSHSHALGQCRNYLNKNFKKALQIPVSSTAEAIDRALQERDQNIAVICSMQAGLDGYLKLLSEGINDEKGNETRFCLVSKELKSSPEKNKMSIAFIVKDEAGALFSVLREFAEAKINLIRIESRPTKKKFDEYVFYVDLEKHEKLEEALKRAKSKTEIFKILGEW
jgi:prephenate dehydratase/prephenate dehydrogenase